MDTEPLEYCVARLSEPIQMDANWDKPAWNKVEPLTFEHHMGQEPEHRPRVLAKLAWDDEAVYIIYHVDDRYVRALAKKYQDPVCRDSCVEFFFTPGSHLGLAYFNIEVNCGGMMLFHWQPEGDQDKAVQIAAEDAEKLEIAHTLPNIVDPEIEEPTTWTLEYRMPFEVIRKYCPDSANPSTGVNWKANLYKCGDGTSHPHWLTWSHVNRPMPQFHVPECFGTIKFV